MLSVNTRIISVIVSVSVIKPSNLFAILIEPGGVELCVLTIDNTIEPTPVPLTSVPSAL